MKKNWIINGLLMGFVFVIAFLIINAIDPTINFHMLYGMLYSVIISLIFMIRAGKQECKNLGGHLGFGEALINGLLTYGIGSLIFNIFMGIMITNNPALGKLATEVTLENVNGMYRAIGMSEEMIAMAMEQVEKQSDAPYGVSKTLMTWISGMLLPGLILALISALIVKKKKPVDAV